YDDWCLHDRERLQSCYLDALLRLTALLEQQGDVPAALEAARQALETDSLHEEAHEAVMRLLAAGGQRAAAVRHFRRLCRLLTQELRDTPSPDAWKLLSEIERGAVKRRSAGHPAGFGGSDRSDGSDGSYGSDPSPPAAVPAAPAAVAPEVRRLPP